MVLLQQCFLKKKHLLGALKDITKDSYMDLRLECNHEVRKLLLRMMGKDISEFELFLVASMI